MCTLFRVDHVEHLILISGLVGASIFLSNTTRQIYLLDKNPDAGM